MTVRGTDTRTERTDSPMCPPELTVCGLVVRAVCTASGALVGFTGYPWGVH
jgi:hypothetical protein